jgi:hypothetical protein
MPELEIGLDASGILRDRLLKNGFRLRRVRLDQPDGVPDQLVRLGGR